MRKTPANDRRASNVASTLRLGRPKFLRQAIPSWLLAATVSWARSSGEPCGVGSPLVRSRTPVRKPARPQRTSVPPTPISASSGCVAMTRTSSGTTEFGVIGRSLGGKEVFWPLRKSSDVENKAPLLPFRYPHIIANPLRARLPAAQATQTARPPCFVISLR